MTNPFGGTHRQATPGGNPLEKEVDPRVLEKSTVRKLITLLHPDHYKGHAPDLAAEMLRWLQAYDAR